MMKSSSKTTHTKLLGVLVFLFLLPLRANDKPIESTSGQESEDESMSVMLSPEELKAIGVQEGARGKRKAKAREELRLDGVIYRSEEDWTVWINGKMYSSSQLPEEIAIVAVGPNHIDFKEKRDELSKVTTLSLNQCVSLVY